MELREIIELLDCDILNTSFELNRNYEKAFGSDLMSDVLAFIHDETTVLITGLVNQQVIRTAEMIDLKLIVFVRGKVPADEVVELADNQGITLLSTKASMFDAAGILFEKGLRGID
ncbi:MAG: hypothetical protein AVO33_06395 [delta proteobacterium ML8_F1]|nr:MAG: hypothetical protein AVO33_06395 [delta proteobacterium ML8_F1]